MQEKPPIMEDQDSCILVPLLDIQCPEFKFYRKGRPHRLSRQQLHALHNETHGIQNTLHFIGER